MKVKVTGLKLERKSKTRTVVSTLEMSGEKMGKVISIKNKKKIQKGRQRRLEQLKDELLRLHGIDLDRLLANEPVQGLTMEEFQDLTEQLLEVVEVFCEEHPHVTVQDLLYALESLKEIIRESAIEQKD